MAKTITGIKAGTTRITASYTDGGVTKTSYVDFTVSKIDASLTFAVNSNELVYDHGNNLLLGTVSYNGDGQAKYYVSTSNSAPSASASGWNNVPSDGKIYATDAGTYYVFLQASEGTNYNAVAVKLGNQTGKPIGQATDASVSVTLASNAGTYETAATLVTASSSHGTSAAYIGYKYNSAATADNQITWVGVGNALNISATASPGTYYIYKKWTADSNHSNSSGYTQVGTLVRSQASDASVSVTLASSAGTYHNAATLVTATNSSSHGTSSASVGYCFGQASKDSDITWVGVGNALTIPATAAAGTYYIYKKWTADGNHSNNGTYTQVGTLTRGKASDASVSVTLASNAGTYHDSVPIAVAEAHGTSSYQLGYKLGSAATADNQITWGSANTELTLPATAAPGTYYIYKKWTADSNHSNNGTYTAATSSNTLVRSQASDASVSVTLASSAGTYHNAATLVTATNSSSHGTSAASVGYCLGQASKDSDITWVNVGTALSLSASAAAGTYYIYKKWTADGNHSNSSSYTQVGTLTRSQANDASVTVTAASSAGTYETAATLVTASNSSSHGTSAAYVGYCFGQASKDSDITWVSVGTALSLSASAAPGTYYIYKKWTADGNHSNNGTYTQVTTLTRSQASDASVSVTPASNAGTYNTASTLVAAANSSSHGTSAAYVGYKYGSAATADSQITWVSVGNDLAISATAAAGTYYIYKKWTADSNHSNNGTYTQVTTLTRSSDSGKVTISNASPKYHSNGNVVSVSGATGTVYYRIGTSGDFSTTIPKATSSLNAGTYTLQYYVAASSDGNYAEFGNSSSPKSLDISISQNNDASVTVTLASNAGTYHNAATLVTAANSSSHGTSAASVGYKLGSAATSDSQITWVNVGNDLTISATAAAGTYYIYKKWTADSNHSNNGTYTQVGTLTRSQANDASVTVTAASSAGTYGDAATLVTAANSTSHGTSAASVGYCLGQASKDSDITWVSVGNALTISANATAGTYYIYKKWTADSNHSNSSNYTQVTTLTRSKATPDFNLISSGDTKYHNTAYVKANASVAGTVHWGTSTGTMTSTTAVSASTDTNITSRDTLGTTTVYGYFVPTDTTNYNSVGSSSSGYKTATAVIIPATDASVSATRNTDASTLVYNPTTPRTLVTASGHGCTYYIGYKKGSAATADNQITWSAANATTLTASDAGTYYVYYKFSPDSNHSNSANYTAISGNTVVISKATATLPVTISGDAKYYHDGSNNVQTARATISKDYVGGTLKYSTDNGSTWNDVTWYSGNLTSAPSRNTVGSTSVVFKVFNTDGNYIDSSVSSPAITLTINKNEDAQMEVSVTTRTYTGSPQVIASGSNVHGISTYYIGYRKDNSTTPTSDSQLTWSSANGTLSATDAGTYYIYYKFTCDGNHTTSDGQTSKSTTYVGSVNINQATANLTYSTESSITHYCTETANAYSSTDVQKTWEIGTSPASSSTNGTAAIRYSTSKSGWTNNGTTLTVPAGTAAGTYNITVSATVDADPNGNYPSKTVTNDLTVVIDPVSLLDTNAIVITLSQNSIAYGSSSSSIITDVRAYYTNGTDKSVLDIADYSTNPTGIITIS